jgi:hypothetical protein
MGGFGAAQCRSLGCFSAGPADKRLQHQPGVEGVFDAVRAACPARATSAPARPGAGGRQVCRRQSSAGGAPTGCGPAGRGTAFAGHRAPGPAASRPGPPPRRAPAPGAAARPAGLRPAVPAPGRRRAARRRRAAGLAAPMRPRPARPARPAGHVGLVRPGHGVAQAAAADGGQQLVRGLAGQHKAHVARRLLQRLEQRIGRDMVHAARPDTPAPPCRAHARWCAGQTRRRRAWPRRGSRGWACASCRRSRPGLSPTGASPAPASGLGHQHAQVGMGAHVDGVATGALAASALRAWVHRTARRAPAPAPAYWPRPGGPLQQPGVAALCQQLARCAQSRGPGRRPLAFGAALLVHRGPGGRTMMASHPLRTNTW